MYYCSQKNNLENKRLAGGFLDLKNNPKKTPHPGKNTGIYQN
jgi:hypothetical protein